MVIVFGFSSLYALRYFGHGARDEHLKHLEVALGVGERLERQVDLEAPAHAVAELVDRAGAGEEVLARLVQTDRLHLVVLVERRLYAVAVVHVDVDVTYPEAVRGQVLDRHREVVVDAESRSACWVGVVQPAPELQHPRGPPLAHEAGAGQCATHEGPHRQVDPGEDGGVRRAEPESRGVVERLARGERLDRADVPLVVNGQDFLSRGGLGLDPLHRVPERRDQVQRHLLPLGAERVLGAEVVGPVRRAVDQLRHGLSTGHSTSNPAPRSASAR